MRELDSLSSEQIVAIEYSSSSHLLDPTNDFYDCILLGLLQPAMCFHYGVIQSLDLHIGLVRLCLVSGSLNPLAV